MLYRKLVFAFSVLVLNLNVAAEASVHLNVAKLFPLDIISSVKMNWGLYSADMVHPQSLSWTVLKESWSDQDEANYSKFIEAIGNSKCSTVDECIKSKENPYRDTEIYQNIHWKSDCAEFGYFLRGYFAWKNHLPFGYVSGLGSVGRGDPRYNDYGNLPKRRYTIVRASAAAPVITGPRAISLMLGSLNSSNYRMGPTIDAHGLLYSDFYSPAILSGSIRPGTMIYDPDGHVMIVSSVSAEGKIHFIDAHPGNGVTHFELSIFNFPERMPPIQGGWFKNWRPIELVGATKLPTGELVGGKLEGAKNAAIKDYSDEQYRGVPAVTSLENWDSARFFISADVPKATLLEFVKFRLTNQSVPADPVEQFNESLTQVCAVVQARVASVEEAIQNRINLKPHPLTLPQNIYGAGGDWETYSTSARDAKIRGAFVLLNNQLKGILATDPGLSKTLLKTYRSQANSCRITYFNSERKPIELTLKEVVRRLTVMSFDPYLCPELRWGATDQEASSCADLKNQNKMSWYRAEEGLRNSPVRDPNLDMGWNLPDLKQLMLKSFFSPMPEVDPAVLLQSQMQIQAVSHAVTQLDTQP